MQFAVDENGARTNRTPSCCGPFAWEAKRQVRRTNSASVLAEKQDGRGSRLSPDRPSDAPISRTSHTASYDLLNPYGTSATCYLGLHVTVTRRAETLPATVRGNLGNKKAGSMKIRLSLIGSAD
jgi:hypothetical protein